MEVNKNPFTIKQFYNTNNRERWEHNNYTNLVEMCPCISQPAPSLFPTLSRESFCDMDLVLNWLWRVIVTRTMTLPCRRWPLWQQWRYPYLVAVDPCDNKNPVSTLWWGPLRKERPCPLPCPGGPCPMSNWTRRSHLWGLCWAQKRGYCLNRHDLNNRFLDAKYCCQTCFATYKIKYNLSKEIK